MPSLKIFWNLAAEMTRRLRRFWKNTSRETKVKTRQHNNEMQSFQMMSQNKNTDWFCPPEGFPSLKSICIFLGAVPGGHFVHWCNRQHQKSRKGRLLFMLMRLWWETLKKKLSPISCGNMSTSVTYFLEAFLTDATRCFGGKRISDTWNDGCVMV